MKARSDLCATVCAACIIIGFSLGSIGRRERGRAEQKKVLEDAVRTWEDEGGLVLAKEEGEGASAAAVAR